MLGFTTKKFNGIVPEPGPFDAADADAASRIATLAAETGALLEQNHLDRALKAIMAFSSHFNQYFQHKEPWKYAPGQQDADTADSAIDDDGYASARTCMYLSVNAIRSLSIAMYPFVPESAGRIWAQLGMKGSPADQTWDAISKKDVMIPRGHTLGAVSPLFERIDDEDIGRRKEQLGIFTDNASDAKHESI